MMLYCSLPLSLFQSVTLPFLTGVFFSLCLFPCHLEIFWNLKHYVNYACDAKPSRCWHIFVSSHKAVKHVACRAQFYGAAKTGMLIHIITHNAQHQHSKGWRRLTFVAMGNRSQAKEEKGEKTHSGHLREEGRGRTEGNTCINLISSTEEKTVCAETERQTCYLEHHSLSILFAMWMCIWYVIGFTSFWERGLAHTQIYLDLLLTISTLPSY